jgi:hypothetical protein
VDSIGLASMLLGSEESSSVDAGRLLRHHDLMFGFLFANRLAPVATVHTRFLQRKQAKYPSSKTHLLRYIPTTIAI